MYVCVCMYVCMCMCVCTYEFENILSQSSISHSSADKGLSSGTCRHADWKIGANISEGLSSSIFRVIQVE
jgi:hypothetical protein